MDTAPHTMPWEESSFWGLCLFSPDPSPSNTQDCSCSSQTCSLAHPHGRYRRQRLLAKTRRKGSCWHEFRQGKCLLHRAKAAATWNKDHRSKVPDLSPVRSKLWHLTETFAVPKPKNLVIPNFSSNYKYLNVLMRTAVLWREFKWDGMVTARSSNEVVQHINITSEGKKPQRQRFLWEKKNEVCPLAEQKRCCVW